MATVAATSLGAPMDAQDAADAVAPETATERGTAFGTLSDAAAASLARKDAGLPVEA